MLESVRRLVGIGVAFRADGGCRAFASSVQGARGVAASSGRKEFGSCGPFEGPLLALMFTSVLGALIRRGLGMLHSLVARQMPRATRSGCRGGCIPSDDWLSRTALTDISAQFRLPALPTVV